MRKIILSLVLYFVITLVQAQSFEKGNINIDLGIGIGVYGTSQTTTQTITVNNIDSITKRDTTDGAVSFILPIRFEYGISDKIGLGVDLTFSNYLIDEEDKININSVKAFDFGLRFNYHLISSDKNDLVVGLGLGISSIKWDFITSPQNQTAEFSGSGVTWAIELKDRIYFSEHFGIFFSLGYKGYSYNLDTEFSPELESFLNSVGIKLKQEIDFTFNGVNLGLGAAIKF